MNANKQTRPDQVPTLTEKSSGLNYLRSNLEPRQGEADKREKATKNDKS